MNKIYLLLSLFIISIYSQDNEFNNKQSLYLVDSLYFQTDEVVVTGTRTNKKIIDIPYSVRRISSKDFIYDRKVSVSDVLNTIPGVFMQSRYGNHDVRISIRGYGSRSNSGIRGVRILLDGIPESEPDGQTRIEAIDFNSVGNIEVVKGNSSSLYTNAPGGVINFINNINFTGSFFKQHNEFGSFGLRRNGFSSGVRTKNYGFLVSYTYHNYEGYRPHSSDYWNILNTVLEVTPGDNTNLQFLGYFVDGIIRLPGSLRLNEYDADPFQAAPNEVNFDFLRLTKKGRIGVRFTSSFDNNFVEATFYTAIKYFHRTARNSYRIMNRTVLGGAFRFVNTSTLFENKNEFSFGGDYFNQYGPIEDYNNISGKKGDILNMLTDEAIKNSGVYVQNIYDLVENKFSFLFSGRYEKITFDQKNQTLEVQNHLRYFEAFTPKFALNYKINKNTAVYTSIGRSFDTPAGNELDNYPFSTDPGKLMNPDLQPQKAFNLELGIKGSYSSEASIFSKIFYELTAFSIKINDEVVPFEVNGSFYFRNSAKTNRNGLEAGTEINFWKNLLLKAAYTFSDFTYKEYTALVVTQDPNSGNITETSQSFSGKEVPSVPKHYFVSSLNYFYTINETFLTFVKSSFVFATGMYVNDGNTEKSGDYGVLNLMLGIEKSFGRLNVILSGGVNNVFDKRYVGFININSSSRRYYEVGEPRSNYGGLTLNYLF